MSAPLWFLWSRSMGNALRVRLRRLREPRYLLGAVLALGWFGFVLWSRSPALSWGRPPENMRVDPTVLLNPDLIAVILAVALLAFAWILPASRAAIAFTESETAWLFPAPLRRQRLVRYKLLSMQLSILFTAILFAVFTGRAAGGAGWARVIGGWLVFSMFQLHRIGASFALTRLYEAGLTDRRRRALFIVALAAVVGLLAWRQGWVPAFPALGAPTADAKFSTVVAQWVAEILSWAETPPVAWVLWPLRAVVAPWFTRDLPSLLAALGPALGVLALHYWWVTRSDVAFEEAAAEQAGRDAERRRRAQDTGDVRAAFGTIRPRQSLWHLRPVGGVAAAFAWRAALEAGGRRRLGLMLAFGVAVLAVAGWLRPAFLGQSVRFLMLMLGVQGVVVTLLFLAPFATAKKLGGELRHAAALKSAPITGADVMRGRLWFTAFGWSLVQLFALALVTLALAAEPSPKVQAYAPLLPAVFGAGALVLIPANATAALLPSAAFLWLPGWFRFGAQRGPESAGVGILLFLSQLLWLGVALGGAAAAGALVGWLLSAQVGISGAILVGAFTAAVPLALAGWFGAGMLGHFFDEHDPSQEE